MKWSLIICFLISGNLFCQKIVWRENQKLIWDNFKSEINDLGGSDVVAYTNCGWEYSAVISSDLNVPVKITIETIFKEDKSWKDVSKISDYSLLHEQKHFDIAELFVRKLRKEISEKVISSGDYIKYFYTIYNKVYLDYNKFQASYDKDTHHGINEKKQAEYNNIISEELEKLKNYKAY